jgi:hypothetical protein
MNTDAKYQSHLSHHHEEVDMTEKKPCPSPHVVTCDTCLRRTELWATYKNGSRVYVHLLTHHQSWETVNARKKVVKYRLLTCRHDSNEQNMV